MLILTTLLALILRIYGLTDWPAGFHVDEAKIGWNAYSILKTGRDDWGHAFSLHYDTFGDFRPTGYFYIAIPAVAILGLNEFAVRVGPAIFGSLTTAAIFALGWQTTRRKSIALWASFFWAISVWGITLSRASSEGILALTFTLLGLAVLFKKPWVSGLLLFLAYFFYHPARLLSPLLVIFTLIFFKSQIKRQHVWVAMFIVLTTVTFYISPATRARLSQVSIFRNDAIREEIDRRPFEEGENHSLRARIFNNKIIIYGTEFLSQYGQYFGSKFFITPQEAKPGRYQTVGYGILLPIELALFIMGAVFTIRNPKSLWSWGLLFLAPLPAALTTEDTPNLHRSLYMLPAICIGVATGINWITQKFPKLKTLLLVLIFLNLVHFVEMYIVHNSARYGFLASRNSAVKPLVNYLQSNESKYKEIMLTDIPDNLYPWIAFYNKFDPKEFNLLVQKRREEDFRYKNFWFTRLRCPSHTVKEKIMIDTLAVDDVGCPERSGISTISIINHGINSPAYYLRILDSK